uniref:Uncharacterized protein n=1 Tax=Acrobeloides nanus TaxID=290746 RepID=A0A914E6P3_9BILA
MSENVFNTFSFKKWAERLREQKLDEESQKQRMEQVARLKEKLKRERELKNADTLSDDDIEKLIAYLNAGNSLNGQQVTVVPAAPAPKPTEKKVKDPTVKPKSDDEILGEIMQYYKKNKTLDDITEEIPMEFKYNHKFGDYPKTNKVANALVWVIETKTLNQA